MEDALHDIPVLRRFAGLDAGESRMPYSGVRSKVEHPFRVLKCQFGYRKVR